MKTKKLILPVSTIILFIVGVVGATLLTPQLGRFWENVVVPRLGEKPEYRLDAPSEVLVLAEVSADARREKLEEIASQSNPSLDRARARYLLASDILREEFDGGKAWTYLQNLEREYPTLAPYILFRQGRAMELTNDVPRAQQFWHKLVEEYPESPVAVEGYYKLGTDDPMYWDLAIQNFPQHPRSQTIAYELLSQNPDQKDLMLMLVEYDNSPKSDSLRDMLVSDYGEDLTPEEWETLADSYWRRGQFLSAAEIYDNAPSTPQNLYRIARGYQVADRKDDAVDGYKRLIAEYPEAEETGLGLRRLATLTTGDEAIGYLNQVDGRFPLDAPQALSQKVTMLTTMGRTTEATDARNRLLGEYPQSDEAANFRWQIAQNFARSNDFVSAWRWAQEISTNSPDAGVAPKASFWVGKWAQRLGQNQEANTAFEYVLETHPHSYYAWRSAANLGQDVGSFTSIRDLSFEVEVPQNRPIPPGGSTMFKELFLLGEDQDAIALFNAELSDLEDVSVTEQFTQGLLKQLEGEYLQSISLIWNLSNRQNPDDIRQWQILRSSPEYWYALFPMPYKDLIVKWSEERNLNPFLVTALMRQESRFMPLIQSSVGATGLMQVMPATAEWIAPQIGLEDYSLTDPEDSINLGTWYLDYTHRTYNNNSLLAIASYNAGPGNINNWLERFDLNDFDEFVENIPFPETKGYVETVFGNYWNYVNLYQPEAKALDSINLNPE